jgi:hypothetical protein
MEVFANTKVPLGNLTKALTASTGDNKLKISTAAPVALRAGTFRIMVDQEIMMVTVAPGTTVEWQVERAIEGSPLEIHANTAPVSHKFTAGAAALFLQTASPTLITGSVAENFVPTGTSIPGVAAWAESVGATKAWVEEHFLESEHVTELRGFANGVPSGSGGVANAGTIPFGIGLGIMKQIPLVLLVQELAGLRLDIETTPVTTAITLAYGKAYKLETPGLVYKIEVASTSGLEILVENTSSGEVKLKGKFGEETETTIILKNKEAITYKTDIHGWLFPLTYSRTAAQIQEIAVPKGTNRAAIGFAEGFEAGGKANSSTTLLKGAFVGVVNGKAPTDGTFALGDWVIDRSNGMTWVCSVAGTPGTWINESTNYLTKNSIDAVASGFDAQTFDIPNDEKAPVKENVHFVKIMIPITTKIGKVYMIIPTGGKGAAIAATSRLGIYGKPVAGVSTRLWESGSMETQFAEENTMLKIAVSPNINITGGPEEFIWIAVLGVGTTMPKFASALGIGTPAVQNTGVTASEMRFGIDKNTPKTTLPASYTTATEFLKTSSTAAAAPFFWAAVSK